MNKTVVRGLVYTLVITAACLLVYTLRKASSAHHGDHSDIANEVKQLKSLFKSQEEEAARNNNNNPFVIKEFWQAFALIKWDFEKPPEYNCKNKTRAAIYYICNDPPFTIKPPCLAYSFGVYNEWGFEETLGNMGCETHSFDPSTGRGDHIHKKVVNFHNIGIGEVDNDNFKPKRDMYVKWDQTWKMRTLPSIMKMLGHEGKVIDVLKVDVEGWEWPLLKQMIDSGIIHRVRQFVIEWHFIRDFPKKSSYLQLLDLYTRMKAAGFTTYYINFTFRGYSQARWRIQCDVLYVNTKFDANR